MFPYSQSTVTVISGQGKKKKRRTEEEEKKKEWKEEKKNKMLISPDPLDLPLPSHPTTPFLPSFHNVSLNVSDQGPTISRTQLRSCVKLAVGVLGSPSLISLTVSVDV